MENIEFRLERPLWMLMLVPVAILLLVIFFTMKKEKRRKGKTVASLAIHAVVAVILAVLAAGFSMSTETDRQSTVILMDVSESTLTAREDMTATCEALLAEFPDRDMKGVVLFGQDFIFIGKKSPAGQISVEKADVSGSDITTALYEAVDLMDKYTHKRIILLSDGKETSGDALYAARRLAEEGVRIDTMYYDTNGQADSEAQISKMTSMGGSYIGDDIRLSLSLESNLSGEATISLYEGETLIEERAVTLGAGEQALNFDLKAETAGMHCYRAVLTCGSDTEQRNNEAFAALRTYGSTSILIIAKDPAEAEELKSILSADSEVTVVSQSEAPADLPTLCNYDGYYLMNVDAAELPEALGTSLDTAVKLFGKSLCFVGGDQTFGKGNMNDTAYSQMLPLEVGANSGGETLLILVIDISASMVNGQNNYLELAKVGAIKALDTLGVNDYVAVITFAGDGQTVVAPLQMTAENKEKTVSVISNIQNSAGTVYGAALNEVKILLWDKDLPEIKHVLFLSDGEPADHEEGIYREVEQMHEDDGIIFTTIGMNTASTNLYILQGMAQRGGGTFTYVKNALDLPNIMLDQSESFSPQYAFEEPFVPLIAVKDEITENLTSLPTVNGYVGMHAKENATVYLTSEDGDPIYATWPYGAGVVSCFTTDLAGKWSKAFLDSEGGQSFIKNALEATYPETRYDAAIIPTVTVDGNHVTITAELPESGEDFELIAEITGPERKRIQLERIASSTYEGATTLGASGEYEITLTWKKRGTTIDEAALVFAVSYSGEYDLFREGDNTLLSEIAASTGGFLDADPDYLAILDLGILRSVITFELPLCIAAAMLMLADIIIRRLTRADIKRMFAKKGREA